MRKRDTDPPEVWSFVDQADAREFYDLAQAQWTETWLCSVVDGPPRHAFRGPSTSAPPEGDADGSES